MLRRSRVLGHLSAHEPLLAVADTIQVGIAQIAFLATAPTWMAVRAGLHIALTARPPRDPLLTLRASQLAGTTVQRRFAT